MRTYSIQKEVDGFFFKYEKKKSVSLYVSSVLDMVEHAIGVRLNLLKRGWVTLCIVNSIIVCFLMAVKLVEKHDGNCSSKHLSSPIFFFKLQI